MRTVIALALATAAYLIYRDLSPSVIKASMDQYNANQQANTPDNLTTFF